MIDINNIKLELNKNNILKTNIESLVSLCIKKRELTFNGDNIEFDIETLANQGIITHNSKNYSVTDNYYFSYIFYQYYTKELKFTINENFNLSSKFIKGIEDIFIKNEYIKGSTSLIKNIWAITIYETNEKFGSSFLDYLNGLNKESNSKEIYNFIDGYSKTLPSLKINSPELYDILIKLIECSESDADYNITLATIKNGIREKVRLNDSFGIDFYDYSINKDNIQNDILSSVISGLYDRIGIAFFEEKVSILIDDEKYSNSIINGLSSVKDIGKDDAFVLLSVFDKFNNSNQDTLLYIPRLLFSIIKSNIISDDDTINSKCFYHLANLISIDNPILINYILQVIRFIDGFSKDKTSLFIRLIEQPHIDFQIYLKQIDDAFYYINEFEYFEKIIMLVADNYSFNNSTSKLLSYSINEFNSKNTIEFEKLVLKLLTNENPKHRRLGHDFFNDIPQGAIKFKYNILNLSYINQYKLWVSICHDYQEPKHIIPCLLPLINSDSSIIAESFICKLEEFSENYREGLIEVLKNHLNLNNIKEKEIYNRVVNYSIEFYERNILIKHDIKELNPYYSQNMLFKEFSENHSRVFNHEMHKETNDKGLFFNHCSTIVLAKGGGWKLENKDNLTKLGKFSTSFSLPRNYFIEPEIFDYKRILEINQNWSGYFIEIEKMLSHE